MIRQLTLFKKDNCLYQKYIHEFAVSCLIDSKTRTNFSKCSEGVLKYLNDIEFADISAAHIVNDSAVQDKVLEANMASIDRYGNVPDDITVNINNEFVKVD